MAVKLGSARGSYGNTKAGDQAGGREISTQDWYAHSKGWVVIRAIDPDVREKIATAMERACANNNIGYSQATRLTLRENIKDKGFDPTKTTKPVNTDCSALVRVCCNFAGVEVSNFNTASETAMLMATGMFVRFTDADHCKSSKRLLRGDILNTKTKGHTAVVLSDGSLAKSEKEYGTIKQADAQTSAHARSSEKPSANGHFLMLVGMARIIDLYVVSSGSALRSAVICFYLSNEGLSLLENATHLGLPVPDKLKDILAQLHRREEKGSVGEKSDVGDKSKVNGAGDTEAGKTESGDIESGDV